MIKFEHRGSKVNSGDLRTPVSFYEVAPNDGPEAGESVTRVLYECFAEIVKVWRSDMEQAKANNTLEDITVKIRDPYESFTPDNKHYIGINDRNYFGKEYHIKSVQPDTQNVGFILVIAGLVE
ncbi:phage head-tail adapter protein [Planococcus sp. SE5232]|uniref:phage head-tail adapter protein n=1 Tax=unclassified Planococcus (in: firmicutes) TaxID=2662419 RepID=UPI003D6C25E1